MSSYSDFDQKLEIAEQAETQNDQEKPSTSGTMSGDRPKKAGRKPGRRGSKMDMRAKLERSRQSARECRARKKMRYQYLEDLVANREKAVFALRNELEMYKQWCLQVDKGLIPLMLLQICEEETKNERLTSAAEKNDTDNVSNSLTEAYDPRNQQGTSPSQSTEEANETLLTERIGEANESLLTERIRIPGKDFSGGATGGPEDSNIGEFRTVNFDDLLSIFTQRERNVSQKEENDSKDSDSSSSSDSSSDSSLMKRTKLTTILEEPEN